MKSAVIFVDDLVLNAALRPAPVGVLVETVADPAPAAVGVVGVPVGRLAVVAAPAVGPVAAVAVP